jgi:hypothetical protein
MFLIPDQKEIAQVQTLLMPFIHDEVNLSPSKGVPWMSK